MNNLPPGVTNQMIERHQQDKIERLKNDWLVDPCWDIENTEGFEKHYIELKAYRIGHELEWKQSQKDLVKSKAKELNCSLELADYILNLEWKLVILKDKTDNFMQEFGY